jgi:hypothetical protein
MAVGQATIMLVGENELLGRALERTLSSDGLRVVRDRCEESGGRPSLVILLDSHAGRSPSSDSRVDPLVGLDELPLLVVDPYAADTDRLAEWRGPLAYITPPFGGRQFLSAVRAQLARAAAG